MLIATMICNQVSAAALPSRRVSSTFVAQIEVWSGSDDSSVRAAADRRDALLQEVDDRQRDFIHQIAESLARIV